jgi:hypothetical protein
MELAKKMMMYDQGQQWRPGARNAYKKITQRSKLHHGDVADYPAA